MQQKTMRYTLTVLASALLTVALLGVCMHFFPMSIYDQSYAMYAQVKEASLSPSKQKSRLIILGDSRPKAALIPSQLGSGVESLTLTGGTPVEVFHTLERYLAHHPAPERILISIAAVHFNDGYVFWERTVKYDYLSRAQNEHVLGQSRRLRDRLFGSEWEARWKLFAYQNKLLHIYLPELHSAFIQLNRGSKNRALYENLQRSHGHSWFGTHERSNGAAYEAAHARFEVSPTLDHYFQRLLACATASGAKVVFAAMPLNAASRRALRPVYVAGYEAYFRRMAQKHPLVTFNHVWPILPDEDFGDPNHVNARGAKKMTNWARATLGL